MLFKTAKLSVLLVAIIGCGSAANAGSAMAGGIVSNIIMQPGGQMFFDVATAHLSRPGCATSDRWAIDTSKPGGQAAAAGIITAFANKRPIGVQGTGACEIWADTESVAYFILPN
jgi:hypothetical protein